MGRRRYAKSGLGLLLAFVLVTSATPASAGQAAQSDTGRGSAAQQVGGQQLAAQTGAGASTQASVKTKAAEAPVAGSSKLTTATTSAVPETPVAEGAQSAEPESGLTSQPESTVESQQGADPATEPTIDPAAVPTQTARPTSGTEDTTPHAPKQESLVAEPTELEVEAKAEGEVAGHPNEQDSSEIVVKVYKMVTGLDGDIDGAAPKADWTFGLVEGSVKDTHASATTNGNGLAVFSGESPGNSGKANLTIEETDPSVDEYDLIQQDGKNAVCSAGGETVTVDNKDEFGFQIKATAGETVTCTVYNRPLAAQLTLANNVKNGSDGTASAAKWKLTATPEMTSSATVTATGSAEGKSFEVAHGTYELSQSSGPANYTWLSLKCSVDGGSAVNIEDFSITLSAGTETTCTFTNASQAIKIDKRAWDIPSFFPGVVYPDVPEFEDGALVPFGTTVTWTYTVTNAGATAINGITVDDDKLAAVTCPESQLQPAESMICTASGQLTN